MEELITQLERGELDPHAARVAIDSRKWLACMFYPRQFGDRKNLEVKIDAVQEFRREYIDTLRDVTRPPKIVTLKPEMIEHD